MKLTCSSTSFIRSLSGEARIVDADVVEVVLGAGVVAGVDAEDFDDEHQFLTSIKSSKIIILVLDTK